MCIRDRGTDSYGQERFLYFERLVKRPTETAYEWVRAVSYTHLDVYKRQERVSRLNEKMAELPEKQREVLIKCFVDGRKYQEVADEMETVSYTHLDQC